MSVLYTNESNPAALKILIAANFQGKSLEIKTVAPHDRNIAEPRRLPYLEVNEDRVIFVSNSAARLFFQPEASKCSEIQKWLDFEATVLAPTLAHHIGSNHKFDSLKNTLIQSLTTLESTLSNENDSLTGGSSITLADVAIWSLLYPLYLDGEHLRKEYLTGLKNLVGWIEKLETKPQFKKAIAAYKIERGHPAYHALAAGARYILDQNKERHTSSTCSSTTPAQNVEVATAEEVHFARDAWSGHVKLPNKKEDAYPVLPIAGEKNVLITSALPYVNNVPHLGNIIGCVLSADVFARFSRLCNYNTLYVCGTDEYGTATETKALEEGLTPKQICDKYFEIHNSIYRWFNIGFDYFGRTSTPEQTKLVQEMFNTVNQNGFMHTQAVEQLLCEKCNRYLADRFVEGGCPHPGCNYEDARGDQCDGCGKLVNATELKNPRCKVCSNPPVIRSSEQFFIDLPKLEPLLLHWMEKSSPGWSNNARVIAKSWMREGLKPRCITRDLKWGVPVPMDGFRDKVFYVWFDAPLGYMSITERYTKEWEKWWRPAQDTKVALYQFMAKDNVPFHTVMFPATLLGANKGYTTVSHVMATEYLNYEDGKFSKSRGVGVFGTDAQSTGIPSDVWRFYLLYVRPENQDSSFSWVDLATKNNSELLNNLGNFVNRALVFCEKNFSSSIPLSKPGDGDYSVLALCTRELRGYMQAVETARLRDGIRHILSISRIGNQYMQSTQPWVLCKGSEEDREKAGTVINICCNLACLLATLLLPYMPDTSRILKAQLNAPDNVFILNPDKPAIVSFLQPGHKIGKPAPLFSKIENERVEELKKKFAGKQQKEESGGADVAALEVAVAKQGDKVRQLKSSGVEKSVWQPEVAILLDLKKKLEAAQKNAKNSANTNSSSSTNANQDVAALEAAILQQGNKVRQLKGSGVDKSVWQPEVAILLDLKKKLEAAQKSAKTATLTPGNVNANSTAPKGSPEDIKRLEEEVAKQGLVVRKLKEGKADKSVWQPEVDKLLKLKGELAVASGQPLATPGKGKKK